MDSQPAVPGQLPAKAQSFSLKVLVAIDPIKSSPNAGSIV